MAKDKDYFSESELPKSKILDIEVYMDKHKKEMVDFIEKKISEKSKKDIKITGEIPDRIITQLAKEFPFGPRADYLHLVLSNALVSSLWCGWLSQAMVNKKEPKFRKEYLEQFQRAITKSYDFGKKYASQRP